jgi:hypothetical protein
VGARILNVANVLQFYDGMQHASVVFMSFFSPRFVFLCVAASLSAFACGSAEETPELDSGEAAELAGSIKTALPRGRELTEVAMTTTGNQMFISNNPERVQSYGILAATVLPNGVEGTRRDAAQYKMNAPSATFVGSSALEEGCPAGMVTSTEVYIAHIMDVEGYVSLGARADADVKLEVTGELGFSPWSLTRDPSFISARSIRNLVNGNAKTTSLSIAAGKYAQITAAKGKLNSLSDGYVDGRVSLRSTNGACFAPYVIAQPSASNSAVPTKFAVGNIAWKGWYNGQGFGRGTGMYEGDRVEGKIEAKLPSTGKSVGYRLGTAKQSVQAVYRLADSSEINFGNYGTVMALSGTVAGPSTGCVDVAVEMVSYVGVDAEATPTYEVVRTKLGLSAASPTRMVWNGPFALEIGKAPAVKGNVVLWGDLKEKGDASAPAVNMRRTIATMSGVGGAKVQPFNLSIPVPGLITAPLAVVLTSRRAATSCPAL